MANESKFKVEVIYPLPDEQILFEVDVEQGTTVQEAIEKSGVLSKYSEIDLAVNKVGRFSRLAKLDDELSPNDRIEIYRPLLADPKEIRKKRAAQMKQDSSAKKR